MAGSLGYGAGFAAESRIGQKGNKATQGCPCGYLGDPAGRCHCTAEQIRRYRAKISGPLLDRIDMHVEVPNMTREILAGNKSTGGESSREVQQRVVHARERQLARAGKPNSSLSNRQIERDCFLNTEQKRLLEQAINKLNLSTRALHRIMKITRTVADLAASEDIRTEHLTEAIIYRRLERLDVNTA